MSGTLRTREVGKLGWRTGVTAHCAHLPDKVVAKVLGKAGTGQGCISNQGLGGRNLRPANWSSFVIDGNSRKSLVVQWVLAFLSTGSI